MPRSLKSPKAVNNTALTAVIPVYDGSRTPPGQIEDGMIRLNAMTGYMEFGLNRVWKRFANTGNVAVTIQDEVGDGTLTDFTLDNIVDNVTDIMVFVGGVYQQPTANYSVATHAGTTTLTFTSPPPAPGVNPNRIIVIYNLNNNDAG